MQHQTSYHVYLRYMSFMKSLLITFIALSFAGILSAQDTLRIKSSVICAMCKDRIELELGYMKGIQEVQVDLSEKIVIVRYRAKKVSPEAIRLRMTEIGYDADSLKANQAAYDALPKCCRKETTHH